MTTTVDVVPAASATRSCASTATSPARSEPAAHGCLRRAAAGTRSIVLDFSDLEYMNSGGIGLLVTLLVRAQRAGQWLHAIGLTDHYRQIFALTRLDEAIGIHDDESRRARRGVGLIGDRR